MEKIHYEEEDAMDGISQLLIFLEVLIPLAAVPRVIYCAIYIAMDSEQASTYKRRLRNALIFVACSQCITALVLVLQRYFY